MRFAYADPPYLGMAKLYADRHPEAMIWDDPSTHKDLIDRMVRDYPDGWALSLHVPSLQQIWSMCPNDVRVAAWVKPFCSFKKNVKRAWSWEPVIFWRGRDIPNDGLTWRDHLSEPIAMKKGLPGAKPWRFCEWVLDGLGFVRGDTLDDLFPGTGIMGEVVARRNQPAGQPDFGIFEGATQ